MKRFERPLDVAHAAAEFGLEEDAFLAELEKEEAFRDVHTRLRQTNLPRERFMLVYNKIDLAMSDAARPVAVAAVGSDVGLVPEGDALAPDGEMAAAWAAYQAGEWDVARDKFLALAEAAQKLESIGNVPSPPAVPQGEVVVASYEVPTAATSVTDGGDWRVQLAALEAEGDTGPAWDLLKGRHPELLSDLRLHVEYAELGHGTFYRVQAGPIQTRSDARWLCSQLAQVDQPCLVVSR